MDERWEIPPSPEACPIRGRRVQCKRQRRIGPGHLQHESAWERQTLGQPGALIRQTGLRVASSLILKRNALEHKQPREPLSNRKIQEQEKSEKRSMMWTLRGFTTTKKDINDRVGGFESDQVRFLAPGIMNFDSLRRTIPSKQT